MARDTDDCLTVMNYNTYLLEVSVGFQVSCKPNLAGRAAGIAEWFGSLSEEELPDVLVFNEVYAFAAERMLQRIASKGWVKTSPLGGFSSTFIACDAESKFGFATRCVNATSLLNPVKEGGIVILTRKGVEMRRAEERVFAATSGSDAMSRKGFWAVEVMKGQQPYWVLGTHTQAWSGPDKAAVRLAQFKQMRAFVDEVVPDGARVCFAGDMNTSMAEEDMQMMQAFGAPDAPATAGDIVPRGFWMELDEDLVHSMCVHSNHYAANSDDEHPQCLDWIVSPGSNDRLAAPAAMRFQYVPVKSDTPMPSDCLKGTNVDDLSDHYGIFAQLWYGQGPFPEVPAVVGKRGTQGKLPVVLPEDVLAAVLKKKGTSRMKAATGPAAAPSAPPSTGPATGSATGPATG